MIIMILHPNLPRNFLPTRPNAVKATIIAPYPSAKNLQNKGFAQTILFRV